MNSEWASGNTGLRRAAVILAALGPSVAERLGPHLSPDQRRALEAAQRSLTDVPPAERREMLASFAQTCLKPAGTRERGEPSALGPRPHRTASRLRPDGSPRAVGEDTDLLPCMALADPPFELLDHLDPFAIAKALCQERTGIIALVATHASDQTSQRLLAALPNALSREVALATADLSRPAPGVLRRVSEALREQISAQEEEQSRRHEGVCAVARALAVTDEETVEELLTTLGRKDPELSEEVARELAVMIGQAPTASGAAIERRPLHDASEFAADRPARAKAPDAPLASVAGMAG